jgi:hypothetical protein
VKIKQLSLSNIGRFDRLTISLTNEAETGSNITVGGIAVDGIAGLHRIVGSQSHHLTDVIRAKSYH